MENLKVNTPSTEIDVDTLVKRMIEDIQEADMDTLKSIAESMYPVVIEDVEGSEGEFVSVTVDQQEAGDMNLIDIF